MLEFRDRTKPTKQQGNPRQLVPKSARQQTKIHYVTLNQFHTYLQISLNSDTWRNQLKEILTHKKHLLPSKS